MNLNGTRPSPLTESTEAVGPAVPAILRISGERPAQPALPDSAPRGGTYVDIGPLESIPLGQGRSFIVVGRAVAVFRQRDGRVFATDNQCPHRGGPLAEGIQGDGKVICPMHGWKIDLASGRCLGEAAAVRVYDVRLVGGRIFLGCETHDAE